MCANIINYSQFAKLNPIFQPQAAILALLSPKLKVSCSEYGCQNRVRSSRGMPFGSSASSLVAFRVLPVFSGSQGFALALPCSFSVSSDEPPSRAFFYQEPLFVENSSFRHPSVRVL